MLLDRPRTVRFERIVSLPSMSWFLECIMEIVAARVSNSLKIIYERFVNGARPAV
jgi:hypothetical protein